MYFLLIHDTPGKLTCHTCIYQADWTLAACADAGANCFIAGSGMFAYDDLSEGCSDLRKVAEAAMKGNVLQKGQTIKDLELVAK